MPQTATHRAPSARDVVTARVAERARRFPEIFPEPLETGGLDRRDAALAYAIDHAVAQRWLTLTAILQTRLNRPWAQVRPPVQAALLVGTAQLLLMQRLPDHAVINEAVAWIKARVRPAASLVNAVLHRVADLRVATEAGAEGPGRDGLLLPDGRVLRFNEPVFDEEPRQGLAQQTSHPRQLLDRWEQRYGLKEATRLAVHDLVHPPLIVAGIVAASDLPPSCEPHEQEGFAVLDGDRADLKMLLADRPGLRVQDPASAAAADATADLVPNLIVEVCAGKGTQTRQLAALHPQARIIATDANPKRVETLREVFRGHDRVRVVEAGRLLDFAGLADLVVVDAPCSNTAVLARRVEAKYRFGPRNLEKLAGLQRQVLADSLRLVMEAGHLLYSTCSLEPEENEHQAQWMVRWHGVRVRRDVRLLPRGGPGDPARRFRDGGYFALVHCVRRV